MSTVSDSSDNPQVSSTQGHPCYQLLFPQHSAFLRARGVGPEEIAARAYRSIDVKVRLKDLGFKPAQRRVPALLIPIYGVHGELVTYQIRPDDPRLNDAGKKVKYETVAGSRMALDVPKRIRHLLGDPKIPLFITEGAPKADAAVGQGLCCIAVLGVYTTGAGPTNMAARRPSPTGRWSPSMGVRCTSALIAM